MAYALFILVNFLLFVRPTDYIPNPAVQNLYVYAILACLVVAAPQFLQQFSGPALASRPVSICVLGLLAAVFLSHLSHLNVDAAFNSTTEFAKKVIYYFLLTALVTSASRLRRFLFWLACFFTIISALTVLEYKEILILETFRASVKDGAGFDPNTNQELEVNRLRASGAFSDPNDFALVLVVGVPLALYFLTDPRLRSFRLVWLLPLVLFLYALSLTYSRGGFLALTVGLAVLLGARLGAARAVAMAAVLLPVLLVFFSGRQTDISTTVNTGQARVDIWAHGLVLFQQAPLFGIGENYYGDNAGQVAHNSFLHCFTELGFFGGTLFLGAFILALATMRRFGSERCHILDPDMRRLRPFLFAAIAAYATGLMALSNSYIESTYAVLGLSTAFAQVTPVYPAPPVLRFDFRLVQRLALWGLGFLLVMYAFARVFHSV
jgi:O-antigen ligase